MTTDSPDGNLTLMKRQTKQVRAVIVPYTVPIENRELVWESSNSNIASVSQNGSVTGVGYGTATITVTSVLYPNISKSFSVVVTSDMQKGVWWDKGDADYYGVTTSILDLKTLVLIEDLPVVTQSDLRYKIVSGDLDKVDKTQLSEGIIAFTTTDVMVRVMVSYNDGTNTYKDYIDIWYR